MTFGTTRSDFARIWAVCASMAVILQPEDHDRWLHAPAEEAVTMLAKYPASLLVVDHMDEPWSSRRQAEAPRLL